MKHFRKWRRAAALALTAGALVLGGCGEKVDGTKTALTVGKDTVSMGTANYILRYQQATAQQMMVGYGLAQEGQTLWDTETSGSDSSSDSSSESVTSSSSESKEDSKNSKKKSKKTTYGDEFKESITGNIEDMVLLKQHASEYGGTIDKDLQKKIDETAKEIVKANKKALERIGASEEDVKTAVELLSYEHLMRKDMVKDTDRNVSDQEAAQKTVTYTRFSQSSAGTSGTDTSASDSNKKNKENAEKLLKKLQEEKDPAKADIQKLASAIDSDATTSQYSYGEDESSFSEPVRNAVKNLKNGEIYDQVIQDGTDYYVVRLDKAFDRTATDSKKESIISEREKKTYDDLLKKWKKAADIKESKYWKKLKVTDSDAYVVKEKTESGTDSTSSSSEAVPAESSSQGAK